MTKKVKLSLNLKHPGTYFRLGRYRVTKELKEYSLNEMEYRELKSDGCQKWLVVHEAKRKSKGGKGAE